MAERNALFTKVKRMNNKNCQLLIRLSEKELEQIQKNAAACDKTVSAYIRDIAVNMCILTPDNTCVTNHTDEISAYRNAINQLVFTIKKTGNYSSIDLEYILDKTNQILKSEREFLNSYRNSIESEKKLIARTVRNIVKKRTNQ